MLSPHEVYLQLAADEATRREAYRTLFRPALDDDAARDIRQALNQGQPLGNSRFIDSIEQVTGIRREPKPRGRPRKPLREDTG